jgi:hypothetical protein
VKAGWIVASTVDGAAVVIRHLPAGLEPGGWASPGPKRLDGNQNVSRPPRHAMPPTSERRSAAGACGMRRHRGPQMCVPACSHRNLLVSVGLGSFQAPYGRRSIEPPHRSRERREA